MLRAKHILGTAGATIISGAAQFILTMVVARALTPSENGNYTQFVLVLNLTFIFFNFGMNTATTYFIATRPNVFFSIFKINKIFLTAIGLVLVALLIIISSTPISDFIENNINIPKKFFYIGIIAGYFYIIFVQLSSIFMGFSKYWEFNTYSITKSILPLLAIIAILPISKPTTEVIVLAHTIAMAIAAILTYRGIFSKVVHETKTYKNEDIQFKDIMNYGFTAFSSNLFHYMAMRGILLILSAYAAPKIIGFLNISLLLLEIALLIPTAIGQVIFPQASGENFNPITVNRLIRYNLYSGIIMMCACITTAQYIVPLIYGSEYSDIAVLLNILTPSMILLGVPRILSSILSGRGYPKIPLIAAFFSFIIGIIFAFIFSPIYGAKAICWTINITSLITASVTMVGYARITKYKISKIIMPTAQDWHVIRSKIFSM